MKRKAFKLSDAEMSVMLALWDAGEPMRPTAITEALEEKHGWSISTVQTLLARLNDKGAVKLTNVKRFRYYQPSVTKEEFAAREARGIIESLCERSPVRLMAGLIKDSDFNDEELAEIEDVLREARKRRDGKAF